MKNPWKGLASYEYKDANVFYGRSQEISEFTTAILDNSLTILYSPSGTGKTSLLKAGISPNLLNFNSVSVYVRLEHHKNAKDYYTQITDQLEAVLRHERIAIESLLPDKDLEAKKSLWLYFRTHKFWNKKNYPVAPTLIVDQFEEIFTLTENQQEVISLFDLIDELNAVNGYEETRDYLEALPSYIDINSNRNCHVVLSLREDYMSRIDDYSYDRPFFSKNRIGLKPLNNEQALEVIMKPCPGMVSTDVAKLILKKISIQKGNLYKNRKVGIDTSLLSLICSELFVKKELARKIVITEDLVNRSGDNVIYDFYNKILSKVSVDTKCYLEDVLLTKSGYRNSVAKEDFHIDPEELNFLAKNRILRIEENLDGMPRVEFTHDLLAQVAKEVKDSRIKNNQIIWDNYFRAVYSILSFYFFFYLLFQTSQHISLIPLYILQFVLLRYATQKTLSRDTKAGLLCFVLFAILNIILLLISRGEIELNVMSVYFFSLLHSKLIVLLLSIPLFVTMGILIPFILCYFLANARRFGATAEPSKNGINFIDSNILLPIYACTLVSFIGSLSVGGLSMVISILSMLAVYIFCLHLSLRDIVRKYYGQFVLSFLLLIAFWVIQYILFPYKGLVTLFVIWGYVGVNVSIGIFYYLEKKTIRRPLFSFIFLLALIFLVISYNPFLFKEYARVGDFYTMNPYDRELFLIQNKDGKKGLRTKNGLLIPVCYDKIIEVTPLKTIINNEFVVEGVYDVYRDMEKEKWIVSEHFEMDNEYTPLLIENVKNNEYYYLKRNLPVCIKIMEIYCANKKEEQALSWALDALIVNFEPYMITKGISEVDKRVKELHAVLKATTEEKLAFVESHIGKEHDEMLLYAIYNCKELVRLNNPVLNRLFNQILYAVKIDNKMVDYTYYVMNLLMDNEKQALKRALLRLGDSKDGTLERAAVISSFILSGDSKTGRDLMTVYGDSVNKDGYWSVDNSSYKSVVIDEKQIINYVPARGVKVGEIVYNILTDIQETKRKTKGLLDVSQYDFVWKYMHPKFVRSELTRNKLYAKCYLENGAVLFRNVLTGSYLPDFFDDIYTGAVDRYTVFFQGDKRGYYDIKCDHIIVDAIYDGAWVFSEDVAAVEQNGRVGFIDEYGKMVIPFKFYPYTKYKVDFVFKDGYCTAIDEYERHGLIDKSGDWVVKPEYDFIYNPVSGCRVVMNNGSFGLLDSELKLVLPVRYNSILLDKSAIVASVSDSILWFRYDTFEGVEEHQYALPPDSLWKRKNIRFAP